MDSKAKLRPRFNSADAERARDDWGCNCGPGALAAIAGLTLDEVRPHMGDFERKRYTNPTLMFAALKSVGAKWWASPIVRHTFGATSSPVWPRYGLARIQWEGPWMKPGVPIAARYRHTHWVGVAHRSFRAETVTVGIFDINCMQNGSGWVSVLDWEIMVVPWLLKEAVPRADGKWHITHALEVERT